VNFTEPFTLVRCSLYDAVKFRVLLSLTQLLSQRGWLQEQVGEEQSAKEAVVSSSRDKVRPLPNLRERIDLLFLSIENYYTIESY